MEFSELHLAVESFETDVWITRARSIGSRMMNRILRRDQTCDDRRNQRKNHKDNISRGR